MIQTGTRLKVIDNSGAKKASCIKILNTGYNQRYATIGALILVTIKSTKTSKNMKVRKGEMHSALILRVNHRQIVSTYSYRAYFENSIILLNKKNKLLGTRIFGKVPKELKYTRFLKLISLSGGIFL